ncbi:uncharacterized protein [Palaemon carinicauda]|uniref:uncharacterized protein n=1 Tax=Palaemon carinicauda TaxID=392227 RepID=UPI0035B62F50
MSGKYQGTQQIIKNECSEAEYIPCKAHSLNLVDTRWSARADAVAALSRVHKENIIVLEEFFSDQNQPAETRAKASGLLKGLKKLETVILLEVWDTVLERFQSASIQLQKPGISLNTAVTLLESLLQFVKDLRSQFDDFEAKAMAKCDPSDVTGKVAYYADRQSQRIRKRKRHHDELDSVEDVTLTGRDMFRVTAFLPIIDKLYAALTQRLAAYSDLREKFGFLSEISNKTNSELKAAAEKLVSSYPNDLEAGLESELLQFAHLMKSIPRGSSESAPSLGGVKAAQRQSPELEMYKIIHRHDMVETFANVEIVLRLYLCMFVTNCTGERSFSKLKLLKNYLRNTMGQNCLSSLTLLSIEHEKLRVLDFTDVIKQFAVDFPNMGPEAVAYFKTEIGNVRDELCDYKNIWRRHYNHPIVKLNYPMHAAYSSKIEILLIA